MAEVPAVTTRMREQVRRWEEEGDSRSVFLSCYALMTGNMLEALETGHFRDDVWVGRLLHRFADYYFEALNCYDCGAAPTPPVWRQVHEASCRRPLHVMQHLLLGMNAHINYDLVLTLDELLRPEWPGLDGAARRRRREDHRRVNQVIADTIDVVQDTVVERHEPWMDWADRLLGPLDEYLLSGLVSRWREEVWEAAEELLDDPDPDTRERLRRRLEDSVLERGELLLRFG